MKVKFKIAFLIRNIFSFSNFIELDSYKNKILFTLELVGLVPLDSL